MHYFCTATINRLADNVAGRHPALQYNKKEVDLRGQYFQEFCASWASTWRYANFHSLPCILIYSKDRLGLFGTALKVLWAW